MDAHPALDRWLHRIEHVASVALFALMAIVFVSVSLRYLVNEPLKDQFDLSRMALGIAVFWGIAAACASDEYVRGDILWDKLPPHARKAVDLFGRAVIVLVVGVLTWQVGFKLNDVMRIGEQTSELRWAIWPFYAVMFGGSVVALAGVVARMLRVLVAPASDTAAQDQGSVVDRAVAGG